MKKEEINPVQYQKILEHIMKALTTHGLKATTMDSIASSLQMSKRTIYEIFGSKEEMFREAHSFLHNKMSEHLKDIFENSNNIMEAIIKSFLYNRDMMSSVSAEFIRDIHQFSNKNLKNNPELKNLHHHALYEVLERGVKEGYFRSDLNLDVQCKMLSIQMEALKQTEELFPPDISLIDIFDNVMLVFLRGISTLKGLEEIDRYMANLPKSSNIS
ncbi:MAG: TetR/AcrR family transcriptional regulator [Muribaculaceae bacterium]|nr:TetR/AcrR family transcriptional regulator [Muribaculaceae bacterium]